MFLISTYPLSDGTHERETSDHSVWREAHNLGLRKGDYGRTWFVYTSRADYLASLD